MPLFHLLILALVQGITEFLPISSSAHLILVPVVAGWQDQGVLIDIAVHIGTLLAVMLYFRRDMAGLLLAACAVGGSTRARSRVADTNYVRLLGGLALASIPLGLFGFALWAFDLVDDLRRVEIIATTSIVFGLLLLVVDRRAPQDRGISDCGTAAHWRIGLAQAVSLIPGTSRSGITMTAARQLGLSRTEAARYAMLLSIPAILMTAVPLVIDLAREGARGQWADASLAAALAFFAALAAIHFLLRWLRRADMTIFVAYRVLLGIVLLVWWM